MKPTSRDKRRSEDRERRLVEAAGLDVDGATSFQLGFDLAVPRASGIYVIADLRGPLYVGKSGHLRRRFVEHFENTHNRLLHLALAAPAGRPTFSWLTTTPENLTSTEIRYIRALRPLCNQHLYIHSNH